MLTSVVEVHHFIFIHRVTLLLVGKHSPAVALLCLCCPIVQSTITRGAPLTIAQAIQSISELKCIFPKPVTVEFLLKSSSMVAQEQFKHH